MKQFALPHVVLLRLHDEKHAERRIHAAGRCSTRLLPDKSGVPAAGPDLHPVMNLRFPLRAAALSFVMALVRILVDGYSLLHNWPELAPGRSRFSAAARDELIRRLTLYQDATGTPVTIFFDGSGPKSRITAETTNPALEVLYSQAGQTADQLIERSAHRFAPYGEVLAVTDDLAERETVLSLGGLASSCLNFIQTVENTLAEMADDLKNHNRRERHRFARRREPT